MRIVRNGFVEIRGLSSETKPTGEVAITGTGYSATIGEGDTYLEIDTGDLYIYDGSAWGKLGS